MKEKLVSNGMVIPLCMFIHDIAELEFTQMRRARTIYIIDYGIMLNPNYVGFVNENAGAKDEEVTVA